jgi:hypothetical protein
MKKALMVTIELSADEARALAVFLKRMMFDDYVAKCAKHEGTEQAYVIRSACDAVTTGLRAIGIAAR